MSIINVLLDLDRIMTVAPYYSSCSDIPVHVFVTTIALGPSLLSYTTLLLVQCLGTPKAS